MGESEIISTIGSIVSNLASSAINDNFASKNLRRNIAANKSYQSWLMQSGPSMQMRGIKAAGISPALSGESGVGSASMPSFSNATVPQVDIGSTASGLLSALSQLQVNKQNVDIGKAQESLLKEQNEGVRIDNESKEIDLENKRGRQDEFGSSYQYRDPITNEFIPNDYLEKWIKEHEGLFPIRERSYEYGAEGRIAAQVQKSEYVTQKQEQKARMSDADAKVLEAKARESQARLAKAVADGQFNQKDVLQAIQRLPRSQYEQILKDIDYKGKLITWQDLNNERFRDSDFGKFVDKMMSGDLSFGDKLLAALTLLGYAFMNK